jgi:hypothetical protein
MGRIGMRKIRTRRKIEKLGATQTNRFQGRNVAQQQKSWSGTDLVTVEDLPFPITPIF